MISDYAPRKSVETFIAPNGTGLPAISWERWIPRDDNGVVTNRIPGVRTGLNPVIGTAADRPPIFAALLRDTGHKNGDGHGTPCLAPLYHLKCINTNGESQTATPEPLKEVLGQNTLDRSDLRRHSYQYVHIPVSLET